MHEDYQIETPESFNKIADEAYALYNATLKNYDLHSAFLDARYLWDKALKARCLEKFGTTKILQKVPAWQRLIGASPEAEVDITPEQRAFVNREVALFVREFKESNSLA
jgi:hypothetical protein